MPAPTTAKAPTKWHWIRRDTTGRVTAAMLESRAETGEKALQLVTDLREMAIEGPIERVCVREVIIGEPLQR